MDFGGVGFDNFLCSNSAATNNGGFALENADKQKWYGSGFLKQERAINEDDLRDFKVAKTASTCGEPMLKIPLQRSNSSIHLSDGHQQMLSFSSPNSHNVTLPYYPSAAFSRNTGYASAGLNGGSMPGVLSGVRGPFTPSQWMELEHQALIYKYITANVPIPSYLLNPIRKAFESAGFSAFSGLRSNPLGWGGFHLGFSSTDPEPGRCRRTDGKKWRCSRDAVADQKYCERHMNRGRHRSRKPVEGQSGHSASGIANAANAKLTPMASSTSASSVVAAGGGSVSNSLSLSHHHQLTNLQPAASGIPSVNRNLLDKENADGAYKHTTVLSMASPKVDLKDNNHMEFGLVCSDSLLNPLNRSSSLVNCRDNVHNNKSQHSLRQFMDNWPKNQSETSTWPDVDPPQLSISIPMVTSDFMSSASSPPNEKHKASPLRLSQLEMGLGVGMTIGTSEQNHRQTTNWVPISWEPSMGGPLGEVLHNSTGDCTATKPLNLIDTWDNSPRLASSPTGVLQRGAFGSLSNSSAGSSPRAESHGLIGPGLMNPSLPAL